MPASILKWKVEEYGAAREQPWLDRAAHRRCRWVTNRSASRCHQQNAETASMIIPQRGKFENRPLGPTIPQSINLLQHCQNPTPRVAAATFRHPFPEGKSYELFLSMFTLVPTNLHLVTLLPGGRQPFRYAPERPTTGKVRIARNPPRTRTIAIPVAVGLLDEGQLKRDLQ